MLKNIFLSFLFISLALPQNISNKINKVLKDKFFDTCLVSLQVEDLTTNKTLFRKNEKVILRPASNMKILTSAAALIYLGEDYNFTTNLFYDGHISNDTLYGDLIVEGGCDPDFSILYLQTFISAIRGLNINVVTGNLIGDVSFKDSLFWGKGWMWDDDPSADAPRLSALNINDNCIEINFENGVPVLSPVTSYVQLVHHQNDSLFFVDRDWLNNTNKIIIYGHTEENVSFKINIVNPERYFLTLFKEVLDSNDIKILGDIKLVKFRNPGFLISSVKRSYRDVIININKNSDNLSAEMTLYAIAEKYFGRPATAGNGLKKIYELIDSLGFDSENYRLVDGSGVSHYNVLSSELIVRLLKYIYQKYPLQFQLLYDSFPIAGVDGTLEDRMKFTNAFNNVHAKTGTLTGVSCLSGYLTSKKKHILAFSIMMQNFVGSSKRARDFQDKICEILSSY